MRLSLWQQFSSNHSADFTVVGRFKSSDEAQKAADEIRNIFVTIQAWYAMPENSETLEAIAEEMNEEGGSIPMPIELELGNQFGIKWDEQCPDMMWYLDSKDVSRAVVQFNTDVIVESHLTKQGTWSGGRVVRRLLDKFGAEGTFLQDGVSTDHFEVRIAWNAPDEETADRITSEYQRVRSTKDRWNPDDLNIPQDAPEIYWGEDSNCGLSKDGLFFTYLHCNLRTLSEDLPAFLAYLRNLNCTDIQYGYQRPAWAKPFEEWED